MNVLSNKILYLFHIKFCHVPHSVALTESMLKAEAADRGGTDERRNGSAQYVFPADRMLWFRRCEQQVCVWFL